MRTPLPRLLRFRVLERDGFRCQYCGQGATQAILHVDHIIPVSKGGDDCLDNLVTACNDCNIGKAFAIEPNPATRVISEREYGVRVTRLPDPVSDSELPSKA